MRRFLLVAVALCLSLPAHAEPLIVRGDRLFVTVDVNGQRVDALLDSGAELTILDSRFAQTVGIGQGQEVEARGTGANTTTADLVENLSITVMDRTLELPIAAVMDLSEIEKRLVKSAVPMIVGRDVFDAGRLLIEIEKGNIGWSLDSETSDGVPLALTAAHGIETIPVEFGEGRTVAADFDLGNGTGLLISTDLAERLGLEPVGVEPGGGIGGVAGRPVVYVPELTIAGEIFRQVRAHVSSDMQVPANVGVGLLRRFRILTDFPARKVWLQARD